jgi:polygalacturonase
MAGGAVGDGAHDDTAAIQATIDAAVANNWPVNGGVNAGHCGGVKVGQLRQ